METFSVIRRFAVVFAVLSGAHWNASFAQNAYPTARNEHVRIDGGSINFLSPETTTGWARGLNFFIHNQPSERVLGLGMYGLETSAHLPGIPTAGEVASDGVALAEMNRKLLEKVEELTLHLIEIKKELDEMKGKLK